MSLNRRTPGLARSAADQRAIDLEPESFQHGLDVQSAEWVVEQHDDLRLAAEISLDRFREIPPLLFRILLDVALDRGRRAHVLATETHDRESQTVFGELAVRNDALG